MISQQGSYEREVISRRYADNETGKFLVSEARQEFSLRGRELERGFGQNNNYSMPIFEVGTNVVTEGYVRSIYQIVPCFYSIKYKYKKTLELVEGLFGYYLKKEIIDFMLLVLLPVLLLLLHQSVWRLLLYQPV